MSQPKNDSDIADFSAQELEELTAEKEKKKKKSQEILTEKQREDLVSELTEKFLNFILGSKIGAEIKSAINEYNDLEKSSEAKEENNLRTSKKTNSDNVFQKNVELTESKKNQNLLKFSEAIKANPSKQPDDQPGKKATQKTAPQDDQSNEKVSDKELELFMKVAEVLGKEFLAIAKFFLTLIEPFLSDEKFDEISNGLNDFKEGLNQSLKDYKENPAEFAEKYPDVIEYIGEVKKIIEEFKKDPQTVTKNLMEEIKTEIIGLLGGNIKNEIDGQETGKKTGITEKNSNEKGEKNNFSKLVGDEVFKGFKDLNFEEVEEEKNKSCVKPAVEKNYLSQEDQKEGSSR